MSTKLAVPVPIQREVDQFPLSEFCKDPATAILELRGKGKPLELMSGGKATVVVQDSASYRALLARIDHLELLESLREGMAAFKRGEGRPALEVLEELRVKYGIPSE